MRLGDLRKIEISKSYENVIDNDKSLRQRQGKFP